jgi:hypothetical protein
MFIVLSIPDMRGANTNVMKRDEKYNVCGSLVDKCVMRILEIYPFNAGETIHVEVRQRDCCLFKEDTISDNETLLGVKCTKELREILIEYAWYPHRNGLVMDTSGLGDQRLKITFSS